MQLRILASAEQDLLDGYEFYESQQESLGAYFLDSLFSDIDSLTLYARYSSAPCWLNRYKFNFLTPQNFGTYFQYLREGRVADYRSELNVKLEETD